jgi:hypothetical protein
MAYRNDTQTKMLLYAQCLERSLACISDIKYRLRFIDGFETNLDKMHTYILQLFFSWIPLYAVIETDLNSPISPSRGPSDDRF